MTPRQRKYWIKMGELRTKTKQAEMRKIIESGGTPVG